MCVFIIITLDFRLVVEYCSSARPPTPPLPRGNGRHRTARRTEIVPHPGSGPEISRVRPDDYAPLLRAKVAALEGRLRDACSRTVPARLPPTEVFGSARAGFRMRANFKIWRT